MNVTELFIRRPVMTTLVMAALLAFGVIGYFALPVSDMPAIEFPTIQVGAGLPGASARTVASSVAAPLEKEFSSIPGLVSMNSTSQEGLCQISLQFDLDRDIDKAAMDVQAAISVAMGSLPDNMPSPPTYTKVNPSDNPIIFIAMNSESLPLYRVNEYAKTFVSQSLSMIPGVAQVMIYGEQRYAVRIGLNPESLAIKGLSIDDVRIAVAQSNVNLPLGTLDGDVYSLTLESDGQLMSAEAYRNIVIAYRDAQPVYLGDVAVIVDGVENDKSLSFFNGKPSITLAVKRQPGSNTIAIVEDIRDELPRITRQLPASITMEIVHDGSVSIRESVDDVEFTLVLAVALVVLVVFLFLRSAPGTIIAGVAVPFSIVSTFSLMHLLGFTLDNLSLMALTLSVGFVVDDAIVMLENVVRHLGMGKKPWQAALDGSREIGFTIISMTLSLAVVFVPILFMSGIIGRVLNEFAMTITVAILISGVVSLSLTPMLCSRMLGASSRLAEAGPLFSRVESWYKKSLALALKFRGTTMIIAGVLLYLTFHLFGAMPKGFQPKSDKSFLMGFAMGQQGITFAEMARHQERLTAIARANENVESVILVIGTGSTSEGLVIPILKPEGERRVNADEVLAELMPRLNVIPGMMVFLVNPELIPIGARQSKSKYQFTLLSPDADSLYAEAEKFTTKMYGLKETAQVINDLKLGNPQVNISINRQKAATLQVTPQDIEMTIFSAFGARNISTIYAQNDNYRVIIGLADRFRSDIGALSKLFVKAANGQMIRLDAVIDVETGLGPLSINHTGQLPSVTISFDVAPGYSLDQASAAISTLAAETLPASISTKFEGSADAFKTSMQSAMYLIVLAVLVIYVILGILYENFFHPITILSGLPSAALGGLLTLAVFGMELNLFGFIGLILLIGIVKKNAIMVVDFAIEREKAGLPTREAVFEGAIVRFRPIMMTTLAAIMGALPIALGFGAGAEARQPLGLVVVGGLCLSQVVTLYLTPVFYTYMDQLAGLNAAGRRAKAVARGEIEA